MGRRRAEEVLIIREETFDRLRAYKEEGVTWDRLMVELLDEVEMIIAKDREGK